MLGLRDRRNKNNIGNRGMETDRDRRGGLVRERERAGGEGRERQLEEENDCQKLKETKVMRIVMINVADDNTVDGYYNINEEEEQEHAFEEEEKETFSV